MGEVRGGGLIAGLELVKDKTTKEAYAPPGSMAAKVVGTAAEEGLICRNVYETVALCPPLIITEADIHEIMTRLGRALDRAFAEQASG